MAAFAYGGGVGGGGDSVGVGAVIDREPAEAGSQIELSSAERRPRGSDFRWPGR